MLDLPHFFFLESSQIFHRPVFRAFVPCARIVYLCWRGLSTHQYRQYSLQIIFTRQLSTANFMTGCQSMHDFSSAQDDTASMRPGHNIEAPRQPSGFPGPLFTHFPIPALTRIWFILFDDEFASSMTPHSFLSFKNGSRHISTASQKNYHMHFSHFNAHDEAAPALLMRIFFVSFTLMRKTSIRYQCPSALWLE